MNSAILSRPACNALRGLAIIGISIEGLSVEPKFT